MKDDILLKFIKKKNISDKLKMMDQLVRKKSIIPTFIIILNLMQYFHTLFTALNYYF